MKACCHERKSIDEIAAELRNSDHWIWEDCEDLCEYAGMSDQWENAGWGDFEDIVYQAAYKLGVEI